MTEIKKQLGRPKRVPEGVLARKPGRPKREDAREVPSVIHIKLEQSQYDKLVFLKENLRVASSISDIVREAIDNLIIDYTRQYGELVPGKSPTRHTKAQKAITAAMDRSKEVQQRIESQIPSISGTLGSIWRILKDARDGQQTYARVNLGLALKELQRLEEGIGDYTSEDDDKLLNMLRRDINAAMEMYEKPKK